MNRAWAMRKRVQFILKTNLPLILSLALIFAWLFEIRFTSLLFLNATQVLQSSFFSLAAASVILLCLPLIRPSVFSFLTRRKVSLTARIVITTCAILLTLLPYLIPHSADGLNDALYIFDGILFGVVLFGIIGWGISIFKGHELITSSCFLISSSIIALLLLVVLNWLIPWSQGYFYAMLPLSSFGLSLITFKHKEKAVTGDNPPNLLILSSKPLLLYLLLFFTGFFVVYMPTMFPKTTNLTLSYFSDFGLGGLNYVSLAALALYIAFFIFILWYVGGNAIGTPIVAFLITVVFAFVFYFLSSMNTSNLAFLIIMPCSMIFVLWTCVIFLATIDLKTTAGIQKLRLGMAWLISGGFLAAVFSTLFLGPFYDTLDFQDTLIVLITGALFIIIIALFVSIRFDLVSLLFPNIAFKEKLDSSSLENRCKLLGEHYRLTGREVEVLMLLAEGRNEPYIAEALTVSRTTAKTHIKHIYQKINVSSRQELLDFLHLNQE
jgi:DNA-binding CsgD family transcriptional regulator